MLVTRHSRYRPQRRGMILLVVLVMLTLFTIVGITFVFAADAQATSARIAREGETQRVPDIDPEASFAYALGQLLYDLEDDTTSTDSVRRAAALVGIQSALRGQSLARNMYGWNDSVLNDKPFNGTGRLRVGMTAFTDATRGGWNNHAYMMNYQYFANDGFLRDPEYYTERANSSVARGTYTGGFNVPYTYPDHNNFYLALIDPSTGALVPGTGTPSFHREYLFGQLDQTTTNVNWTNKIGKYLTLRPRPVDQLTQADVATDPILSTLGWPLPLDTISQNVGQLTALVKLIGTLQSQGKILPYPVDRNGDVKNLDGAPGGCDSIWIDINAPIMTANDGRRYKVLVAPLILDLDSRLDLNVVGNILGTGSDHRSHQGWGPWEVNPGKVLTFNNGSEWKNIILGTSTSGLSRIPGRYDTLDAGPNPAARRPIGQLLGGPVSPRGWAQVDFDGKSSTGAQSTGFTLPPNPPNAGSYNAWPTFPLDFGNGGNPGENQDHPATMPFFSPVFNQAGWTTARNRRLPVRDMAQLLRYGGTGSDMLASDLLRLLPNNLVNDTNNNNATKRRNLVTLLSADLDRPGATPWVWDPRANDLPNNEPAAASATKLTLTGPALAALATLSGNKAIPFPVWTSRAASTPPVSVGTEFDTNTWRSISAALMRINLNRQLTNFPAEAANTNPNPGLIDLANNRTTVETAVKERQAFAKEIYDVLRAVTGAMNPTDAYNLYNQGTDKGPFRALRYLAQLAVNIVDYLDNDGFSTPFGWYPDPNPTEYVYGVEIPRLVINETYVQFDNNDIAPPAAGAKYNVNVWVELFNPMQDDSTTSGRTDTKAYLQPKYPAPNVPVADDHPYRVLLCNSIDANNANANEDITTNYIRHPDNPEGDPTYNPAMPNMPVTTRIKNYDPNNKPGVRYWGPNAGANQTPQVLVPAAAGSSRFDNTGLVLPEAAFYVLGPEVLYLANTNSDPLLDPPTITFKSPQMTYAVDAVAANDAAAAKQRPTIVLQRLANPALPYDPAKFDANNVANPLYNPYITIDVVDHTAAQVYDGRTANTTMAGLVPEFGMHQRRSFGRRQPYAGASELRQPQLPGDGPVLTPPQVTRHTFLRQNSVSPDKATLDAAATDATLKLPFDWMVHLDRVPISPAELLHVTHARPSELTLFFVRPDINNPNNLDGIGPHQHIAPWTDPSARLYRFLEFAHTGPFRTWNSSAWTLNGRAPGRVNLNGMWNLEIFQALCDRQNPNVFSDTDVSTIFTNVVTSRSPGYGTGTVAIRPTEQGLMDLAIAANYYTAGTTPDRPFWSLAMGQADANATDLMSSAARGLDNTILRNQGTLFDVPDPNTGPLHRYKKKELLTKIFNNVTTRSNVFAVWMTVGVFEVGTSGQIMAEVGKSENRHVRHRMFAIVDRTHLRAFDTTVKQQTVAGSNTLSTVLTATSGTDSRTNRAWSIQQGTVLTFSPNSALEETVVVQANNVVNLANVHPVGNAVICRGNPGPWAKSYDPRQDTDVVPFFAVID